MFAIFMLQQLTKMVLAEEAERIASGGHGAYLADHISRNPLLIVQRLLGHRQPGSAMRCLRYIRETNAGHEGSGGMERPGYLLRGLRRPPHGRGSLMARRGDRKGRTRAQVPEEAAPATGRIGVRVTVSERRGRTARRTLDPAAYRCTTLAAQLADEAVEYMPGRQGAGPGHG
ncbi:hypothetical protein [Streptomyces sp. NPDC056323]|uniref:hypothetical protein n=1 Tax=Streptomyces sp. NPDC056323 TaxID=3345784 RepID=UPI0035DB8B6C